jgi:molybdate transport system substrate-binding protein
MMLFRTMTPRLALLALALASLAVVACSDEERTTLRVLAPAQFESAFQSLAEEFEERNPGVEVRFEALTSGDFARQVRDSTADLIIAPGQDAMASLLNSGLVQDPQALTSDTIMLAAAAGVSLSSIEDLARDGMVVALPPAGDPLGDAARTVIDRAAEEYGAEWKALVTANIKELPTATEALKSLEDGDAAAAFVYRSSLTDLAIEAGLASLPLPARLAVAVVYPAALTAQPIEVIVARELFRFLVSDDGQAILGSFGFGDGL